LQIDAPLSPTASYAMRDTKFRETSQKTFFKAAQQFGAEKMGA